MSRRRARNRLLVRLPVSPMYPFFQKVRKFDIILQIGPLNPHGIKERFPFN